MSDKLAEAVERLTEYAEALYHRRLSTIASRTPEGLSGDIRLVLTRIRDLEGEVESLRERWACVEPGCGRTPDGYASGDLYGQICHGCHRCMEHAEPTCTICGDAEGMRLRCADLKRALAAANERWRHAERIIGFLDGALRTIVADAGSHTIARDHPKTSGFGLIYDVAQKALVREALRSTPAAPEPEAAEECEGECGRHGTLKVKLVGSSAMQEQEPEANPLPLGHPFRSCSATVEHLSNLGIERESCHYWHRAEDRYCGQPESAHEPTEE